MQLTTDIIIDVPHWVTTSAVQPTFLDSDILSTMVASWHPTGPALAEGGSSYARCGTAQIPLFNQTVAVVVAFLS